MKLTTRPAVRGKLDVYYDGNCPVCLASKAKIEKFDTARRLRFKDINVAANAAGAAPRFGPDDLRAAMHVQLADGTWRIGFYAWLAILSAVPKFAILGRLGSLPFISEIGRSYYRWFAANRYVISKLLGIPGPCDANGACNIGTATTPAVK